MRPDYTIRVLQLKKAIFLFPILVLKLTNSSAAASGHSIQINKRRVADRFEDVAANSVSCIETHCKQQTKNHSLLSFKSNYANEENNKREICRCFLTSRSVRSSSE